MTKADALKAWALGNVMLLGALGTADVVSLSVYGVGIAAHVARLETPKSEKQQAIVQYIEENGIEDPRKLCSTKKG